MKMYGQMDFMVLYRELNLDNLKQLTKLKIDS